MRNIIREVDLSSFLLDNNIYFERNVDLKNKTWIKRGGITNYWVEPKDEHELKELAFFLYSSNLFFEIVGHTSNLYFLNTYNPDIVISTRKTNKYNEDCYQIICEPGVSISKLARFCVENGYEGYEGLVDLPGTVAAAVYNNSGCYKCNISELLLKIDLVTPTGKYQSLTPKDLCFKERSSALKRKELEGIILKVFLKKQSSMDKEALINTAKKNKIHRKKYQEKKSANLGSVFPSSIMHKAYKNSPLFFFLRKIIRYLPISIIKKQKLTKNIFLIIHGKRGFAKYLSNHSINCFIWKDQGADQLFLEYVEFMKKITKTDITEIEIRD